MKRAQDRPGVGFARGADEMTTIAIKIACNPETCGNCPWHSIQRSNWGRCGLFMVVLQTKGGVSQRCAGCLAAEKAAKGEKR